MIVIRLARGGRKRLPIFTIVAAEKRRPRDGQFLERLGQYNPLRGDNVKDLKIDALRNWVSKGAIMSDTVRTLLKRNNVKL